MNLKVSRTMIILAVISLSSNKLFSQNITGTVVDMNDNATIPFVNIHVKGTTVGGISDIDGKFGIEYDMVRGEKDSLVFSFIGYGTKTIALNDCKKDAIVYMEREAEQLNEVVLSNKALPYTDYLMRKIIENKNKNNPDRVKKVQFTETALLSVYLSNIENGITEKKRFRKDKGAFIADSDSTVMMPILLAKETIKRQLDRDKNINSSKTTSVKQEGTLNQLNGLVKTSINKKIAQNVNFYDENIDLLGRSFQSPIASSYKSHYKLFLADSSMVNGAKQYQFMYYPKNEKSIAFDGSFWVDAETYALTKIEASLPIEANINFIQKLDFEVTYKKLEDDKWFVASQKTNTDFSFVASKKKKRHFSVQKNQSFSNFIVGHFTDDSLGLNTQKSTWDDAAFGDLSQETSLDSIEVNTIKGIRQLRRNGFIKFVDRFGAMTLNGYYNLNKFDLGPYFDFYYRNGIEGSRFTIPLRTSEKLAKNFTVGGYLGYGTKDKKFKYGFDAKYLLPSAKRTVLSFKHFDDFRTIAQNRYIEFIQENPYSRGGGNILSVFGSKNRLDYNLLKQKHFDFSISHEATENARYLLRAFYDTYKENEFNRLVHNGANADGFRTIGLLADIRYSKARNFDQQFFSRIYYGTTKPVYHLTAEIGNNKITEGANNGYSKYYGRINASIKKKFLLGPTFIRAFFEGGYIFGEAPYPLLNNPSGNQNIGLARYNYNLLNPISFSSDVYANLHLSFNGGGFLFNKVPLLSSLNIRESMSFKAFYGKLRNDHNRFFQLPTGLIELPKEPYMELGVGIANIFKVLRVEYVTRLNSGAVFDNVSVKGGLKFRIEVSF